MSRLPDPIREGLDRGWRVLGAGHRPLPRSHRCDVVIVGSGAGAGITAELLTAAGLEVLLIEEGPLRSSRDFHQREGEAYPALYQESAGRKTADKAINILQGRCVGGSTTVNWTSSFRTPSDTLQHWVRHFALEDLSPDSMAPWFEQAERRLHVQRWQAAPNRNNELLRTGAGRLGIPVEAIPRNVKGCWNLGSCGMGCPTNAKQSMLLTTIPLALERGASLWVQVRAERLVLSNGRAEAVQCVPVALNGDVAGEPIEVRARHVVIAGGAINSPGLLLRSGAPDPHQRLGWRTFLHPVVMSAALYDQPVEGWAGAPQSLYSDHFLHEHPIDGPLGYKIEAPPLHPVLFASTLTGFGAEQAELLRQFPNTHVLLALLRDGFHPDSQGGRVGLRGDGSPELDYPLTDVVTEAARRALTRMAEIQFASGAREVMPVHERGRRHRHWADARDSIARLSMTAHQLKVVSAHVMGGCGMSGRERLGVVRPDGRHWQLKNVSVHDGSLFPTSIGANPQLSIYGLVARLATGLAHDLSGREVTLSSG